MTAKDAILWNLNFSDRIVKAYLEGLSDEDLLVRPVPGQNHIAWQLGHLIASERSMLEGIKAGSSPALSDEFLKFHARDEFAPNCDDASGYLKKDEYLAFMNAQRAATTAVLESMSDEELDSPAVERLRNRLPTVGSVFSMIGTHVTMHVGQFVSVRRKLEKPVAI